MTKTANAAQADYWSSAAGLKWIDHEQVLDAALAPMRDRILDLASLPQNATVLDVGCGTGDLSFATARRVPQGQVTGADISEPLIERARARPAPGNCRFLLCDAQTEDFGQAYSHVISRLGLMFFADPVAAMGNIARALPKGGKLAFAAWGPPADTPWFAIPKAAAEAQMGPAPTSDPHAPGPLAFQDIDHVAGILHRAGWINIETSTETIPITPGKDIPKAASTAAKVGPATRILTHHSATPRDVDAVIDTVAQRFEAFMTANGLSLPAQVNMVTAKAPAP